MADLPGTTTVFVPTGVLSDHLSDVGNLPRYSAPTTSARPGEGDGVTITARVPDGAQRTEWGSEGPSECSRHLDVRPSGDSGSQVQVHLRTTLRAAGRPAGPGRRPGDARRRQAPGRVGLDLTR